MISKGRIIELNTSLSLKIIKKWYFSQQDRIAKPAVDKRIISPVLESLIRSFTLF